MWYVIQPAVGDPEAATIISRHRTWEAGSKARDAANRNLRRQPGMRMSWVDWGIVEGEKLSATKRAAFKVRK